MRSSEVIYSSENGPMLEFPNKALFDLFLAYARLSIIEQYRDTAGTPTLFEVFEIKENKNNLTIKLRNKWGIENVIGKFFLETNLDLPKSFANECKIVSAYKQPTLQLDNDDDNYKRGTCKIILGRQGIANVPEDIIIKLQNYRSPLSVNVFIAQDKNLLGFVFKHQIQRDFFMALLTSPEYFEEKEKLIIQKRFPDMSNIKNNSKLKCLITFDKDAKNKVNESVLRTLYIPAFHETHLRGPNYYYAVFNNKSIQQIFSSLLKLPTAKEIVQEDEHSLRFLNTWLRDDKSHRVRSSQETQLQGQHKWSCLTTCSVFTVLNNNILTKVVTNLVLDYHHDCSEQADKCGAFSSK